MEIDRKEFYGKLKKLTLPIAFQSLMLASVAAGDALMLGHVAQDQMTAVSLATQIQFVQNMFIMSVTAAGSILGLGKIWRTLNILGTKVSDTRLATKGIIVDTRSWLLLDVSDL